MDETVFSTAAKGIISLHFPNGEERSISVEKATTTIGRLKSNDIVIDHPTISRKHARLILVGQEIFIEDLGSTNRTTLEGKPLTPHTLTPIRAGQKVTIGFIELRLEKTPQDTQPTIPEEGVPRRVSPGIPTLQTSPVPNMPAPGIRQLAGSITKIAKSRGIWATVMIGTGLVLLCGLAVLLVISAISGNPVLSIVKGTERGCVLKPMKLVSKGGVFFQPEAIPSADQAAYQGSIEGSLLTPTPGEDNGTDQETRPILSLAFLELPFPYDGGNDNFGGTDEQFRLTMRLNDGKSGRINSFFDHMLPLYPISDDPNLPSGQEQPEPPIGNNVLMFNGTNDPYIYYSGHPGYDFSTYEHNQATTPVFAAADGVVFLVGKHSSGALFAKIKHTIIGVGNFQTIYWHLHPDKYYNDMLGKEGQPIKAGTRIGTMGNTGFSTGIHLHFEVRFDRNNDGDFSLSEVVDPSGWIPSLEYPNDPWFERSGNFSYYLWKHPLGVVGLVSDDGSGSLEQAGSKGGEGDAISSDDGTMCARKGTLPPGGLVYWSWAPSQPPLDGKVAIGNGCVLSVLDEQGQPVSEFNQSLYVSVPFDEQSMRDMNPKTLAIYWQASGSEEWVKLKTNVDFDGNVATAQTKQPGKCALMGVPVRDIIPPKTQILLEGEKSRDGQFYKEVYVTLKSEDPSGIEKIEYSLDGGSTWLVYTQTIVIEPGDTPEIVLREVEVWGGLPGVNLVLANATDKAGNIEMPPAHLVFSINPKKNPLNPNLASAACVVPATITQETDCQKTPRMNSELVATYPSGTRAIIFSRNWESSWFLISRPDEMRGACWVAKQFIKPSRPVDCLSVVTFITDSLIKDEPDSNPPTPVDLTPYPPPSTNAIPYPAPPSSYPPPAEQNTYPYPYP